MCHWGKRSGLATDTRRRGKYSPINNSAKQTLQTTQAISTTMQLTKFFNSGGISGLLQLATTNRGSRPEIQDDPGGKGRGGEARDNDLQHHQQGILLHAERRTSVEKIPQRDNDVERRGHRDIQRRNDNSNRRSREAFSLKVARTPGKRFEVQSDDQDVNRSSKN